MEMLVAMVVFSIVMGIAFVALNLNEVHRESVGIQIQLYNNNRRVQDVIAEELSLSKMDNSLTITPGATENDPDSIDFQIPIGTDDNYDIMWGADGSEDYYVRYILDITNHNLERKTLDTSKGETQTRNISGDIANLKFENNLPECTNCIEITTTSQRRTNKGRLFNLSTTAMVYLRND
jgi:type II secretory pathway component PulJ